MLETTIICAADTASILFKNQNHALWEDSDSQSGYVFSQNGEWMFYVIDEAQNRHIFDWNGLQSEGIYKLSGDTIWLFQSIDKQWEKIRGLLILQKTDTELIIKLLDKFDAWSLSTFDVHLQNLNSDSINIFNSEQWEQSWDPIYSNSSVFIENSFPVCVLKDKKIKRLLKSFEEEVWKLVPDTTNISIEIYFAKRNEKVCLIANSLFTFSGKNIWGVLYGMEIPTFILDNDMNGRLFTKQSATITYAICMEETKYKNGITVQDICDEYLSKSIIHSICIPLW